MPRVMNITGRVSIMSLAVAVATAVLAALLAAVPASAQTTFTSVNRVDATDRITAAVGVARTAFPDGVSTVVLARVDAFPDALSGAPLAAVEGAPILFTLSDHLHPAVAEAIRGLGATRAVLLGGTAALAPQVEVDLTALGVATLERIAGPDRFSTSKAIAERVLASTGTTHAYLALGNHSDPDRAWADAVAVSGLAAWQGNPVLLTPQEGLPASTVEIMSVLESVTLVGGTAALPEVLEQQVASLGVVVDRIAGPSRFHTSLAVTERAMDLGASPERIWIASGGNFSDPLAVGPAVASQGVVMLLADGHSWRSQPARDFVGRQVGRVRDVQIVGEEAVFPPEVQSDIEQMLSIPSVTTPPVPGAPVPSIPADAVRLPVGADLQQIVNAHAAGSTFVIAAGVHRGQQITPRSGDVFIGEAGATLAGSKVLDAAAFTRDGAGRWYLGGQAQRTTTSGNYGCTDWSAGNHHYADCGYEAEVHHGEELFANGQRLRRVNGVSDLDTPGEWYFDLANSRIYTFDNPATLGLIETTTADYAFLGAGTDSVTVANLAIRHYGSQAQRGALNGRDSTNWTVVAVDASHNHGAGIGIGPGMTVTHSRVAHNGHIGIGGRGDQPVSLPVIVRHTEIAHNTALGFQHGWEAGGTKFVRTDGMVFEHNWVHHNASKGVWFDIENRNGVIRHNLVEDNTTVGIFWEISYNAVIHDNIVRNNHTSGDMTRSFGNILVVSSPDVEVHSNHVGGQGNHEIMGIHQNRGPGLTGFNVHDNHIVIDSPWGGGHVGVKDQTGSGLPFATARYADNTYHTVVGHHSRPFHWDSVGHSADGWAASTGETVISAGPAPAVDGTAFLDLFYGAR